MLTAVAVLALTFAQADIWPEAMLAEARTLLDAPSTPERMHRIEALLKRVAHYEGLLPDLPTLEKRIALHTEVLERFRSASDAAGVRRQAEWIVAAEHLVHAFNDPEMPDSRPQAREQQAHVGYRREIRTRHAAVFLTARLDLARAVLAAGDRDKALWWLTTAERCLGDIPGAVKTLRAERDRIRRTPR